MALCTCWGVVKLAPMSATTQDAEPTLNLIEPQALGRGLLEMGVRMSAQPSIPTRVEAEILMMMVTRFSVEK